MIDAADKQHGRQHQPMQLRPDLGFFQLDEKARNVEIAEMKGKLQPKSVVAVAIMQQVAP